jgi:hypothetical protein
MIKPNTEPFAKFKIGDKIRGRDSTGIVDGQPGIVRGVHTRYPTQEDYEDLTNPGIIYSVQFMKGNFLLQDYQMDLLGKQQLFNFMYDFSHIAKMRDMTFAEEEQEQEFVEPLE